MSDEIKEILQKIENVANRETASRNALMEMKDKDYQLLLDYITNLQTIEREYSSLLSENAELQQKYDKALSDLVKESHKRMELSKNYDRIYNENCKLRENHNISDISLLDENDRLNNIIDELEKCIKEEYDYCDKRKDPAFGVGMGVTRKLLDRLKELKENNRG